jgi:uncharacterized membrane-anchored protein YitT (DUF2179 family)
MNRSKKITWREVLLILGGTTIMAFGLTWFLSPAGMVIGGVSGLGIIIRQLTGETFGRGIPLWVTNLVLNIPLFVLSIRQRGLKFAQKSLLAVVWLSVALWISESIPNIFYQGEDLLLAAVFGGVSFGVGIGMALKASSTTGGTDMLASIIKYQKPHFPMAKLMLAIDGTIILGGLFVFGPRNTMYAMISVVINSYVMNTILEGMHFAKAAFIMSSKNEQISQAILLEMKRGNTGLKARGMYTKQEGEMLFVVVSPKEIVQLRRIVREIDPQAFMTISDIKEVLGEGFMEEYDALTL